MGKDELSRRHIIATVSTPLPASNMAASGTMAGAAYQSLREAHLYNKLSTE